MEKLDDKMRLIGSAVVEQAEQESRAIVDEANAVRDRELSEHKEQVVNRMFEQIQQRTRAVRQQAVRDKALAGQAARRELLGYRQELAALVYGAVRARLAEYAAGEAYRASILQSLHELQGRWDHTASTVQLRRADLALEADIRALLPGCRVEASREIRLGGYRLHNSAAGILLDETLDLRLEETRPWFLQNSGLSVEPPTA